MPSCLRAFLIPLILALSACTKPPAAGPVATRQIVLGMVAKSEANDVFQAARTGAEDAANNLGEQYNMDIRIDWQTPPEENAGEQADAIARLVNEKVDGIMVSCSDAQVLTTAINDAVDKGVPVVCFDSDAPASKRLCDYGTDDIALGRMLVDAMAKYMNGHGTIAILAGNQSALNLQKRVQGVREELAKYPGMHELNNGHGVFYHEELPSAADEAIKEAMNANPGKIDGWVMVGGWALFNQSALDWPPGSIKVVSCDALPSELDYVRKGYVQELIAQDSYGWGYKSVTILVDKILHDKMPDGMDPQTHVIVNPLTPVTIDNVDQFAHSWDKWLQR
ncbi:MAG TPA: substrate-binding domain-containing protein [Tepidisphaeraceae bacterium]|nr:substrate-binding domain-containing protein [Tepidisphaeraceae bacterium]